LLSYHGSRLPHSIISAGGAGQRHDGLQFLRARRCLLAWVFRFVPFVFHVCIQRNVASSASIPVCEYTIAGGPWMLVRRNPPGATHHPAEYVVYLKLLIMLMTITVMISPERPAMANTPLHPWGLLPFRCRSTEAATQTCCSPRGTRLTFGHNLCWSFHLHSFSKCGASPVSCDVLIGLQSFYLVLEYDKIRDAIPSSSSFSSPGQIQGTTYDSVQTHHSSGSLLSFIYIARLMYSRSFGCDLQRHDRRICM
jgi:hypothetical protein